MKLDDLPHVKAKLEFEEKQLQQAEQERIAAEKQEREFTYNQQRARIFDQVRREYRDLRPAYQDREDLAAQIVPLLARLLQKQHDINKAEERLRNIVYAQSGADVWELDQILAQNFRFSTPPWKELGLQPSPIGGRAETIAISAVNLALKQALLGV